MVSTQRRVSDVECPLQVHLGAIQIVEQPARPAQIVQGGRQFRVVCRQYSFLSLDDLLEHSSPFSITGRVEVQQACFANRGDRDRG